MKHSYMYALLLSAIGYLAVLCFGDLRKYHLRTWGGVDNPWQIVGTQAFLVVSFFLLVAMFADELVRKKGKPGIWAWISGQRFAQAVLTIYRRIVNFVARFGLR